VSQALVDAPLLVGIFVGGRGSRMGGVAKGLLRAPDSELSLVERLSGELARVAPRAEVVLVGAAEPYASLGLSSVTDEPPGVGPLGGLLGLLAHAERRGATSVLSLACDLPRLDAALLARLLNEAAEASALVAEQGGVRNPLVARYAVGPAQMAARAAFAAGQRSLQAVLDRLEPAVARLRLSDAETRTLDDWDTLSEVERGGGKAR
jgi:molybdopterin-guanine dinucleotide biosynthesis protein A